MCSAVAAGWLPSGWGRVGRGCGLLPGPAPCSGAGLLSRPRSPAGSCWWPAVRRLDGFGWVLLPAKALRDVLLSLLMGYGLWDTFLCLLIAARCLKTWSVVVLRWGTGLWSPFELLDFLNKQQNNQKWSCWFQMLSCFPLSLATWGSMTGLSLSR